MQTNPMTLFHELQTQRPTHVNSRTTLRIILHQSIIDLLSSSLSESWNRHVIRVVFTHQALQFVPLPHVLTAAAVGLMLASRTVC